MLFIALAGGPIFGVHYTRAIMIVTASSMVSSVL